MAHVAHTEKHAPARKPARQRYVSSLDGLRALCALAVVGYHMRLPWLGGGLLGVTVLFVLSGYLVTAGLLREYRTSRGTIDLKGFWVRRLWRLMPTVVVFIAVTGALCTAFSHELLTKMRPDILPALLMVINWTKILANESYFAAAGAPSPLTHFWSLAIEAQFYLVWPPILYLLMRRRVSRRCVRVGLLVAAAASAVLMALLYVPGADPTRPYYGTDTRAMSLLLGCWLALVWPFDRMSARRASRLQGRQRAVIGVVGPLCAAALVAMMVLTEGYTSFSYYGGILLCSVVAVGLVAALVPEGSPLARVFSLAPLEWVGRRSYAIYLWHYPILELLNPLKATTGVPWWKLLLELALILVVSDLSYRLVETPLRAGVRRAQPLQVGLGLSRLRGLVPAGGGAGKAGEKGPGKGRAGDKSAPGAGRVLRVPAFVPALAVAVVAGAITVYGLATVEPVTAAGDNPSDKRVMQASLRKPPQDGVYDVVLIGDSVALGANEQLNEAFPHGMIDTRGERQAPEAIEVLEGYLSQGVVGSDVVISIGTNGILDTDEMDAFVSDVGPERDLWLVNLRSPNAKDVENNALIDMYVAENDNVHLIDWYGASAGHDDWLIEDGIHLTWDGRDAYAQLVVDTMGYELPNGSNSTYSVMVLGDSVALDAADQLAEAFPRGLVDTADGRLPSAVVDALASYRDQDVMGSQVVVCVGNDDPLTQVDLESIVEAVGSGRTLWLVNVRTAATWETSNNALLDRVAAEHDNVRLIDWHAATVGHDDWLADDGTHLTDEGATEFAQLVLASTDA